MHVAMLTREYTPYVRSGLGVHVVNLAEALAKNIQVSVISYGSPRYPAQPEHETIEGVRVIRLPCTYDLENEWARRSLANVYYLGGLVKLVQDTSIDLIHAHDVGVAFAAIVARQILKLPLVTTLHMYMPTTSNAHLSVDVLLPLRLDLMNASDLLIAVSKSVQDEIIDFHISTPSVTIYNGVRERATTRMKDSSPRNVLFVGRVSPQKGVHILLQAANMIKEHVSFKLQIVGRGNEVEALRHMAQALDFPNDRIDFVGFVEPDVIDSYYRAASIVVIPSLYEPFGLVALEAMASERPVIASGVGGLKELLEDGRGGVLVPPDNPAALAEAIKSLLLNPGTARQLAIAGKQKSIEYSWQRVAQQTLAAYQHVLAGDA